MASLRVRIKNPKTLKKNLPKLQRSLSVQVNTKLKEESKGIFLLEFMEGITLDGLKVIRTLLDSYGFEFHYPEVDYREIPMKAWSSDCNCSDCARLKEQYNEYWGTDF
jgi:hypothetical protein